MTKKYDYNTAVLSERDGMAAASGPYNNNLRSAAKDLGAEWKLPCNLDETGAWVLPLERADELRALLAECYGEFVDELAGEEPVVEEAEPVEVKRMLVRATDTLDGRKRGIERLSIAGVEVARIWRGKAGKRDFHDPAKVYLADGVELVSGGFKMDDAGRMQPVGETVLSVDLPVDAENTVEFEVLVEDSTQEQRFSEAVEKEAAKVEGFDKTVYERVAALVSLEDFAPEANKFDLAIGSSSRLPSRAYAYLLNREGDSDCPSAMKNALTAVRRRVAGGEPETLPEWSVSAHERLAIRNRAIGTACLPLGR